MTVETIPGWIPFDPETVREIYADALNLEAGVYGWGILLGIQAHEGARAIARIRMSPQLTKVFYLLLQKQLREYEGKIGVIQIPSELVQSLGLSITAI